MNDFPVTYERKVRFSDTDAQGIVFNANYLVYFDDAITDYFEALGLAWNDFTDRGYDMVLGRAEIDYRSAAQLGETVVIGVRVAEAGTTSLIFELKGWEAASGRLIVQGREIQVMLDHETFEKRPVPDFYLEAVERLQGEPVARRDAT